MTVETRAKLSIALTGRVRSPETRAKMSVAKTNPTPETRAKMSAAKMGHPVSLETRAKISLTNKKERPWRWLGGRPVSRRKHKAKRRALGFNPLNSPFLGCEGHHINQADVIYVPKELHRSVYHDQFTGQGMAEINRLAGLFLTEDWT